MIKHVMHYTEDQNTGEMGLSFGLDIDYPSVATEGLLVAHDLIEHVNGLDRIGTIADELQALSGVWLTRASHGTLRRDNIGSAVAPDDNVWADVQNMGVMVWCQAARLVMRDHNTIEDPYDSHDWAECFFDNPGEFADFIEGECSERPPESWVLDYFSTVKYHLILGEIAWREKFAVAIDRFGEYSIHSFFWDVADAVQPYINDECWAGVEISIDYERLEVQVVDMEDNDQ